MQILNQQQFFIGIDGVQTYKDNFYKLVLPHLKYDDTYNLSLCPYQFPADSNKYITILHNRLLYESPRLNAPEFGFQNFISHYKPVSDFINLKTRHECTFIPMSIDLDPISNNVKNGKFIYYGNLLTENKKKHFDTLKSILGDNLDYISNMRFNGTGELLTQQESLNIIANYSYGIGVGRCALELLASGAKVLVIGENIAGTITSDEEFNLHHSSNISSFFYNNSLNLNNDIEKIMSTSYEVDINKIDMNNYITNYINVLDNAKNNE